MTGSLILLIAVRTIVSLATRAKVIPTLSFAARAKIVPTRIATVPMMQRGSLIHTRGVNDLQLQMLMGAPSGDDSFELRSNAGDVAPNSTWKADISDLAYQKFPPVTIYGMGPRWLLNYWADESTRASRTSDLWEYDTAVVLNSMRSQVNLNKKLEMVGLVPKRMETRLLLHDGAAVPGLSRGSPSALGVFSREKLKDNHMGTLRNEVFGQFHRRDHGKAAAEGTGDTDFDVFALQGLAAHPRKLQHIRDFDHSAEAHVLLYNLGRWANEEHKLLVVPESACKSIGGKDLTDYYAGFGFQKVEMEDGSYVLVYPHNPPYGIPLIQYGNTYETAATIPGKVMISMKLEPGL